MRTFKKANPIERAIAVILAFSVLITFMASGFEAFAAFGAHTDVVTLRVTDSNGAYLSGASVTYGEGSETDSYTAQTGSDGVAELTDISTMLDGSNTLSVNYKVSLNGYAVVADTASVSDTDTNIEVVLTALEAPAITYRGDTENIYITAVPVNPDGTTVSKVYYTVDGAAGADLSDSGSGYTCTISRASFSTSSVYMFYYTLADGSVSAGAKLNVAIPTVSVSQSTVKYAQTVTFTGVVSAGVDSTGIAKLYISRDVVTDGTPTGETEPVATIDSFTDNKFTYDITATDYVGNYYIYCENNEGVTSATSTYNVKIDNTAPVISSSALDPSLTPNSEGWLNTYPKVVVTLSDVATTSDASYAVSGIDYIYYMLDGSDTKTKLSYTISEGKYALSFQNVTKYSGALNIYAVDYAGNVSAPVSVDVKIDCEKPVFSGFAITTTNWTNSGIDISGNISDALSGIDASSISAFLDDNTPVTVAYDETDGSFSITLPPQNYNGSITIKAFDLAGNYNTQTAAVKMDIQSGIVASASFDISDQWTKGKVVLSGVVSDDISTAPDAVSQIKDVYYYKQGAALSTAKKANFSGDTYSVTLNADNYKGKYVIYCVDYAGNVSAEFTTDTEVWMDKAAPSASVSHVGYNGVVAGTVTFKINASDAAINTSLGSSPVSGLATLTYYGSNADESLYTTVDINTLTYADGYYQLVVDADDYISKYAACETNVYTPKMHYFVTDNAGNNSTESYIRFQLDTTKPEITTASPSTSDWTKGSVTVTGTVQDMSPAANTVDAHISGIDYLTYNLSNDPTNTKVDVEDDGSFSFDVSSRTYKGNVVIVAYDKAGNSSAAYFVPVKMDKTGPVINVDATSEQWTNTDVVVSGSVNDEGNSGVASLHYAKGGDIDEADLPTIDLTDIAINDDGTYSFTLPAEDYHGQYLLIASDNVGNLSLKYVTIKNDISTPKVEEVTAMQDWTNQAVTVSGSVSDSSSGVKTVYFAPNSDKTNAVAYNLDNGATQFSFSINRQDFFGEYLVYCVDNAGNESTLQDSRTLTLKMDITAPVITDNAVDISDWTNQGVMVTCKADDVAVEVSEGNFVSSSVDKVYIRQNTEYAEAQEMVYDDQSGMYTFSIERQNYNGKYEIYCTDYAGNISEKKYVSVLMDIERCVVNTAAFTRNGWTNTDLTINGIVEDVAVEGAETAVSGVEKVYYKQGTDGESVEITTFNKQNGEYSFRIPSQDYEGDYIIYCVDAAGNISLETSVYVMMDVTAPQVDDVTATPSTWTQEGVIISGTVSDGDSGVKQVFCEKDGDTKIDGFLIADDNTRGEFSFSIAPQQYNGLYRIYCIDNAGNTSLVSEVTVYMDNVAPEREVTFSTGRIVDNATGEDLSTFAEGDDVTLYYTDKAELTVEITEKYFVSSDVEVKVNGVTQNDLIWNSTDGVNTTTLSVTENGRYVVSIEYADNAGNAMPSYTSPTIVIDDDAPVISVEYSSSSNVVNEKYFTADRVVEITITEDNFRADEVEAEIGAKDINGFDVPLSTDFAQYLKNTDNWTKDGNSYTATITLTDEAVYNITIGYSDIPGNDAEDYRSDEFVVDKSKPSDITISYSQQHSFADKILNAVTFGYYYYNDEVTVTVMARDNISGVKQIELSYFKENGASNVNAESLTKMLDAASSADKSISIVRFTLTASEAQQYRGYMSAMAVNGAELCSDIKSDTNRINVVDNIAPGRTTVTYATPVSTVYSDSLQTAESFAEGDDVVLFFKDRATASFSITEANFESQDVIVAVENHTDGTSYRLPDSEIVWTKNGDTYSGEFSFEDEGDYSFELTYIDRSGNSMTEYNSPMLVVDGTAPVITTEVSCDKCGYHDEGYHSDDVNLTVKVQEHSFRPADFEASLIASDLQGGNVNIGDYSVYFKNPDNWTLSNGVYTASITLSEDAAYSFAADYIDLCGIAAEESANEEFVLDNTAPLATDITVSYTSEKDPFTALIDGITFGYYSANNPVTVKITVKETAAPLKAITCEIGGKVYTAYDSSVDEMLGVTIDRNNVLVNEGAGVYSFTLSLPKDVLDLIGHVKVTAENFASLVTYKIDSDDAIVIDSISPEREVRYNNIVIIDNETQSRLSEFSEGDDITLYSNADTTAQLVIREANFYGTDVVVKLDDVILDDLTWTTDPGGSYVADIEIKGNGSHKFTVDYTDRSENEMTTYTSPLIIIDDTIPAIEVEFIDGLEPVNGKYYTDARKAKISITEPTFRASGVSAAITAEDAAGNAIALDSDIEAYMKNPDNWTEENGVHSTVVTFSKDAFYTFSVSYLDFVANTAQNSIPVEFAIDTTAPDADLFDIEYSEEVNYFESILNSLTFGMYYYRNDVTVTVTADDRISGIDTLNWYYTAPDNANSVNVLSESGTVAMEKTSDGKYKGSFTLSKDSADQYYGSIAVSAVNGAGLTSEVRYDDNKVIIVDSIAPDTVISYSGITAVLDAATGKITDTLSKDDNVSAIYTSDELIVTIVLSEANFYPDIAVMTVDGTEEQLIWEYDAENDAYKAQFSFKDYPDGRHSFTLYSEDRSGNAEETYTSNPIIIDTTAPIIDVEYVTASGEEVVADGCYGEAVKAEITVTEENFSACGIAADITSVDEKGSAVALSKDIAAYLSDDANWTHTGNVHTATVELSDDAVYTFGVSVEDIAGNSDSEDSCSFTVDTSAPLASDITIEYSEEINYVEQIVSAISFGTYYYQPDVTVTVTAKDTVSGVDSFNWYYIPSDGADPVNEIAEQGTVAAVRNEDGTYSASFTLSENNDKQYNGNISVSAVNKAGVTSAVKSDNSNTIIVDSISPDVSAVFYNWDVIIDNQTGEAMSGPDDITSDYTVYCSDSAKLVFAVKEANFYPDILVLEVNGVTYTLEWIYDNNSGEYCAEFNLADCEDGVYTFTINVTDRSGNSAFESEVTKTVIIDSTAPVVDVKLNGTPIAENCYNAGVSADITVTDNSFNAEGVIAEITAKDINGNDIELTSDIAGYLSNDANWTHNGDVHTATVNFVDDAIYSFGVSVQDILGNAAQSSTLSFVADKTAPDSLNVTYSKSVIDTIIESVTFGFYNAPVVAKIVAEDNISGISHFTYTFNEAAGVARSSEIYTIEESNIIYGTSSATAIIILPDHMSDTAEEMAGIITFSAYDNAANKADSENRGIVIDKTAPVAEVTLTAPDSSENGINYYDDEVQVSVSITENNFASDDVKVNIIKDGKPYPVNVSWNENDVAHTANLEFTENGNYIVSITYSDKSGNDMEIYISPMLSIVIDDIPDDGETSTPDDGETSTPDDGETSTPDDGETSTPDDGETSTPDDGETSTPDDGETSMPDDGETSTPDDGETSTPDDGETSTPDDGETSTPDNNNNGMNSGNNNSGSTSDDNNNSDSDTNSDSDNNGGSSSDDDQNDENRYPIIVYPDNDNDYAGSDSDNNTDTGASITVIPAILSASAFISTGIMLFGSKKKNK